MLYIITVLNRRFTPPITISLFFLAFFLLVGALIVFNSAQNQNPVSQATNSNSNSDSTQSNSENCQGNINPSGKCFSCKKDSPTDQVNILDFSCFAKWYGKTVDVAPTPTPTPTPTPGGIKAEIIPTPQKISWDDSTSFRINGDTKIIAANSSPEIFSVADKLIDYIKKSTGLTLQKSSAGDSENAIIVGLQSDSAVKSAINTISSAPMSSSKPEGYTLGINNKIVVISGFDAHGAWYGVQTLRQMLEQQNNTLKGVSVFDYPDISYRAAHFRINQDNPPKGRVVKICEKFIENILSRGKYNAMHVFFQGKDFAWTSNKSCVQNASVTPAEMKELISVANDNFIEVVPERFPVEEKNCQPGGGHAFCVSSMWNKEKGYIDEQLALYNPKHFNILLDTAEANLAECGGDGKAEFAKGVTTIANYLKDKGVTPLTWAQGIASSGLLSSIPKNVGMIYWDYNKSPNTSVISTYLSSGFPAYAAPAVKYESPPTFSNVYQMAKAVKSKNAAGIVVTTWTYFNVEGWSDPSYGLPKLGGLIVGGDYAWNTSTAKLPVTYNPNKIVLDAMK